MTLSPPNSIKLLGAPLAVFAAVLAVLLAVNGGDAPALRSPPTRAPHRRRGPRLPARGARGPRQRARLRRARRRLPRARARDRRPGLLLARGARLRRRAAARPGRPRRPDRRRHAGRAAPRLRASSCGSGARRRRQAPALARPYDGDRRRPGRARPLRRPPARSIQRLVDSKPGLASYARASYYRELSGDPRGAVAAMRLAVSAGGAPENVAYVQVLLGDLELRRGRVGAGATGVHRRRLRSLPGYPAGHGRTRTGGRGGRRSGRSRRPPASRRRACCRSPRR